MQRFSNIQFQFQYVLIWEKYFVFRLNVLTSFMDTAKTNQNIERKVDNCFGIQHYDNLKYMFLAYETRFWHVWEMPEDTF